MSKLPTASNNIVPFRTDGVIVLLLSPAFSLNLVIQLSRKKMSFTNGSNEGSAYFMFCFLLFSLTDPTFK